MSSLDFESRLIRRGLCKINNNFPDHLIFYRGKIENKDVVYLASGIGKTNASRGTTILIEKFLPELIINFGVAGAYPLSGLRIGGIAVAEKETYGDEGLFLQDGFHTLEIMGIPLLKRTRKEYFNEFSLGKKLVERAVKSSSYQKKDIRSGNFVTVSTCSGTKKRAIELKRRFDAICENMEGAAVAHICAIYGIPMLEIRGISNIVQDRDIKKWDLKLASENCQRVVINFLKSCS
ncbi:MAG: futalosine hydrolase [Nitrospirota bacterium]